MSHNADEIFLHPFDDGLFGHIAEQQTIPTVGFRPGSAERKERTFKHQGPAGAFKLKEDIASVRFGMPRVTGLRQLEQRMIRKHLSGSRIDMLNRPVLIQEKHPFLNAVKNHAKEAFLLRQSAASLINRLRQKTVMRFQNAVLIGQSFSQLTISLLDFLEFNRSLPDCRRLGRISLIIQITAKLIQRPVQRTQGGISDQYCEHRHQQRQDSGSKQQRISLLNANRLRLDHKHRPSRRSRRKFIGCHPKFRIRFADPALTPQRMRPRLPASPSVSRPNNASRFINQHKSNVTHVEHGGNVP